MSNQVKYSDNLKLIDDNAGATQPKVSIWDKIKNGNFANGIRELISRLFGKVSTPKQTNTQIIPQNNTAPTSVNNVATTYGANIDNVKPVEAKTTSLSETPVTAQKNETTYAENINPAQTETVKPAENNVAKPMSYEDYLEQMRTDAENSKKQADREAEIAKERAVIDAQVSYDKNKATYGANAEQVAQMGLSGGGYSDYLDAQAYAQKRADVQHANVIESASKAQNQSTYQDYINAINQKLADKALYEEQLADQREYAEQQKADERAYNEKMQADQREYEEQQAEKNKKDGLYATLWEGVQDPDNTYTVEAIKAIGEEYGLSEAQIETLSNILSATLSNKEDTVSTETKESIINSINSGEIQIDDDYLDGLSDFGLSDSDLDEIKEAQTKYNDKLYKVNVTNVIRNSTDNNEIKNTMRDLDSAYASNNISKDTYQEIYYEFAINLIEGTKDVKSALDVDSELGKMKSAGKISETDYNNAKTYLYGNVGKVLPKSNYTVSYDKNIFGTELPNGSCLILKMDGKSYQIETVQSLVDNDTSKVLTNMIGGTPTHGSIAQIGDQIYIYRVYPKQTDQYKNGWIKVKTYNFWTSGIGTDNKDFYKDYETKVDREVSEATPAQHNQETYKTNKQGNVIQNSNPQGTSDFVIIQNLINEKNLREGDRGRWGQALKFFTLPDGRNALTVWQSLSDQEKSNLKGTIDK